MPRIVVVCLLALAGIAMTMTNRTPERADDGSSSSSPDSAEVRAGDPTDADQRVSAVAEESPPTVGPLGSIDGILRAENGKLVPDVIVFLAAEDHSWRRSVRTDGDGRFSFAGIGGRQTLTVPPTGVYRSERRSLEFAAKSIQLEVVLRERETVRFAGRILDAEGCPIDARVVATVEPEGGSGSPTSYRVDDRGYFDLPGAPLGRVVVRTSEPVRTEIRGLRLRRADSDRVELQLDLGRALYRGRIRSASGDPVPGAGVHLQRTFEAAPGVPARSFRTTFADADGYFSFRDLGPGTGSLTVMASGYTTAVADVPSPQHGSLHVVRLDPIRLETRGRRP